MTHPGQVLGPDARAQVAWRTSSYSFNHGGNCVEAGAVSGQTGRVAGRVAIRHSHHPNGLALLVSQHTWAAFLGGVKNDEFAT
jgi:hypothetical protein